MKKWIIIFGSTITLFSCSGNKNKQGEAGAIQTIDSTKETFFPVTTYLQGQINSLDSLPVTILQVTTASSRSDSAWISKENLKPLLKPFISDAIEKQNLISFFKESKFNDQSTETITFTYDPKIPLPDTISIRHWDVYIDPEKGLLKRVYIVKQLKEKDAVNTLQLTWQCNKWAKIVTIANQPGGSSSILSEVKWIWDLNE